MEIGEERSIPWLTFAETESGTTVFGRSRLGLLEIDESVGSGGVLLGDSEVEEGRDWSTSTRPVDLDKGSASGVCSVEEGVVEEDVGLSISTRLLDLE